MTNKALTTPFDFYVKNIQHYYNRNSVLEVIGKNIPPEFEDVAEIILSNLDSKPESDDANRRENYNKAILTRAFCGMFNDKDNDDYFGKLFENLLGNFDFTGSIHFPNLNLSEKLSKFEIKARTISGLAYDKAHKISGLAYDNVDNTKNRLKLKMKMKNFSNKNTDIADIHIFKHFSRYINYIKDNKTKLTAEDADLV